MTPNQLTALAREYAREECNKSTLPDKKQLHEDKLIEFYDVYGFLLRRFCIVEKERVKDEYHEAKFACGTVDPCSETWAAYHGQKSVLKRLFPEIAKEVEG